LVWAAIEGGKPEGRPRFDFLLDQRASLGLPVKSEGVDRAAADRFRDEWGRREDPFDLPGLATFLRTIITANLAAPCGRAPRPARKLKGG